MSTMRVGTTHGWKALVAVHMAAGSGDGDGEDGWDGNGEDDNWQADSLAAAALGEDGAEGVAAPQAEADLLEQLKDQDPNVWQPAESALREMWRNQEGPFAVDELGEAMRSLRNVNSREQASAALSKTISAVMEVVKEYPQWPEPLNELALCELLMGKPDNAVKTSLKVLELNPAHFDCLIRLTFCYIMTGNKAEAARTIDKLKVVIPGLAEPMREMVAVMGSAIEKAKEQMKTGGQSGKDSEQQSATLALEISQDTLEKLGPLLERMQRSGGFMDTGAGGISDLQAAAMAEVGEEEEGDLVFELDDMELDLDEAEEAQLRVGAEVEIFGLKGAAKYNGRRGAISGFEESRGRFVVELSPEEEESGGAAGADDAEAPRQLAVKGSNLRLCKTAKAKEVAEAEAEDGTVANDFIIGARVVLQGLKKSKQHNGKEGVVRGEQEGRFVVELVEEEGGGALLSLKSENLRAATVAKL